MTDTEIMRVLIETAKATLNNEELWSFTRLPQEKTGLPYEIFVDDNETYKVNNHDLWLYVKINGILIPVTISENPQIKKLIRGINIDFTPLFIFISANLELLTAYADDKVDALTFFNSLTPILSNKEFDNGESFFINDKGERINL